MKQCQNSFNELEEFVTPSDIIEYLYCPRFVYYIKDLGIRQYEEKRFKVQVGREKHIDRKNTGVKTIRKRINGVSKECEKYLISKKYGVKGIVDEIYKLDDNSYSPLDYKYAEFNEREYETHKIQMALYSLIIEDVYKTSVNKFFLVFMRSKNLIKEIEFDDNLRKKSLKYLNEYRKIKEGFYPKATRNKARCIDCCYRNICQK